jgi:hypothetical protein
LSTYIDNYHTELDRQLGSGVRASEMISEVYVPRKELAGWLEEIRRDCRQEKMDVIFGVFRLIEKDDESFLAWAKEPYACIIFNLHVVHSRAGLEKSARDFRLLIDRAIQLGGSYYLTYHRWATRKQVESCYPQFPEFLRLKKKYDPEERFQSDWYHHTKRCSMPDHAAVISSHRPDARNFEHPHPSAPLSRRLQLLTARAASCAPRVIQFRKVFPSASRSPDRLASRVFPGIEERREEGQRFLLKQPERLSIVIKPDSVLDTVRAITGLKIGKAHGDGYGAKPRTLFRNLPMIRSAML